MPGTKSIQEFEAEFIEAKRPLSLIRRLAELEEVGNMVVYVCSSIPLVTSLGNRRRGAQGRWRSLRSIA